MKPIDFAKAAGIAAIVLAIDVLIAIGVVFVWGTTFEPGHPRSFYATAGVPIARWSTRIAGTALIFGAGWLFARRQPERNAVIFAATMVAFYALFDGASVAFQGFFTRGVAITMLLKLVAGVAGAFVGLGAISARRAGSPA